jgi:ribosomal protein S27AE
MMQKNLKSGICPQCGSNEIYFADNAVVQILPTTYQALDKPKVDNYACGDCGYAEFYITSDTLDVVKTRWHRISSK